MTTPVVRRVIVVTGPLAPTGWLRLFGERFIREIPQSHLPRVERHRRECRHGILG